MDRAVLLYDEDCGFCRFVADVILAWDRHDRLRALAIQDAEADELLGRMDPELRLASWHLVTRDGRVYSGGRAVDPLMRVLPAGAPVAALARAFPRATDLAYELVARNRSPLGRAIGAKACSVDPSGRNP